MYIAGLVRPYPKPKKVQSDRYKEGEKQGQETEKKERQEQEKKKGRGYYMHADKRNQKYQGKKSVRKRRGKNQS